jgi:hypothetical protein
VTCEQDKGQFHSKIHDSKWGFGSKVFGQGSGKDFHDTGHVFKSGPWAGQRTKRLVSVHDVKFANQENNYHKHRCYQESDDSCVCYCLENSDYHPAGEGITGPHTHADGIAVAFDADSYDSGLKLKTKSIFQQKKVSSTLDAQGRGGLIYKKRFLHGAPYWHKGKGKNGKLFPYGMGKAHVDDDAVHSDDDAAGVV